MANRPRPNCKCRDCGELNKATAKELSHAAQPRCTRCGGTLEPLDGMREGLALVQTIMRTGRFVSRRAAVVA